MKEAELREHATCSVCKKPVLHTRLPLFWTVKVERHGLNLPAINRQQGLAMMLGGNGALASIMGPNEEMTTALESQDLTLCEECAMPIMELLERAGPVEDGKGEPG